MIKQKINEWIRRYLPAEIVATLFSIGAGLLFRYLFRNNVAVAFAATWGDNIGYYGYHIARETLESVRKVQKKQRWHGVRIFWRTLRNLVLEFGVGEFLDSFVVRPFVMYVSLRFIPVLPLALIVANIVANITFYIPVISAFELRKKVFKD